MRIIDWIIIFALILVAAAGANFGAAHLISERLKENGFSSSKIESHRIVVRDEGGAILAQLERSLQLFDDAGKVRVELGWSEANEPMVSLRDKDGASRLNLLVSANGVASVHVGGGNEAPGVLLQTAADGLPFLGVFDPVEAWHVAITNTQSGLGVYLNNENKDTPAGGLELSKHGALLGILDPKRQSQAYIGQFEGEFGFSLLDKHDTPRGNMSMKADGSTIMVVSDKFGNSSGLARFDDGSFGMFAKDRVGQLPIFLGVLKDGSPRMILSKDNKVLVRVP